MLNLPKTLPNSGPPYTTSEGPVLPRRTCEVGRQWGTEGVNRESVIRDGVGASRSKFPYSATNEATAYGNGFSAWERCFEQLGRTTSQGLIREAWLGPMQLLFEETTVPMRCDERPWKGSRLFVTYRGDRGLYCDNRWVRNEALISYRWDAVKRVTASSRASRLIVAIDENWLEDQAFEATGQRFFESDDGKPGIYTTDPKLLATFERTVLSGLGALETSRCTSDDLKLTGTIRRRIVDAVIGTLQTPPEQKLPLPPPCTRAYVVDRAMAFIEQRLGDPLSIADISAAVRVCPRTLCYSFQAVLGISPSKFLLAARLNRVRRDLLCFGGRMLVQDLAAHWGFCHMGRFARYYCKMFGELPSDTAAGAIRRVRRPVSYKPRSDERQDTLPAV
jgi:AraC family ethanolamine operon transcriptional activator